MAFYKTGGYEKKKKSCKMKLSGPKINRFFSIAIMAFWWTYIPSRSKFVRKSCLVSVSGINWVFVFPPRKNVLIFSSYEEHR